MPTLAFSEYPPAHSVSRTERHVQAACVGSGGGGGVLNSHRLITSLLIFKLGLRHPQYKVLSILRWITDKEQNRMDVKAKDHLLSFLCRLYSDTFMTD